MKLSDKEIAQAEKYLAQFEKNANSWRWVRWFLLTFTVVLLMSVPWHLHKAEEAYELNQTEGLLTKLGPKSEILEKYVEAKIGLLRAEFDHSLKLMFPVIVGGPLLGYVIGRWAQDRRHKLIAKCVRVVLLSVSERSPSNKPLNTDAGDAGAG